MLSIVFCFFVLSFLYLAQDEYAFADRFHTADDHEPLAVLFLQRAAASVATDVVEASAEGAALVVGTVGVGDEL